MPVHKTSQHGQSRLWIDFFDRTVPSYVKATYSPDARWAGKPFSREDVRFFAKGVRELSEQFTEGRSQSRQMQSYLQQAKFRSSYLLYFLPLQAAKFLTLFEQNRAALDALPGRAVIWDLGAGPGTATLALLTLLSQSSKLPEHLEIHWVDTQDSILKDGRALLEHFIALVPQWRTRITLHTHNQSWWEARPLMEKGRVDLALFGNVLNESLGQSGRMTEFWKFLTGHVTGAGVLWVEPADRGSSQFLSQLRDQALEDQWIPGDATAIWAPCLHAGRCPLATGRDWCHTSVELEIEGQWFRAFSIALGSAREWIKYSYLWLASRENPAPARASGTSEKYRVLSDPLSDGMSLLCQPDRALKMRVNRGENFQGESRRKGRKFFGRGSLWSEADSVEKIIPVAPGTKPKGVPAGGKRPKAPTAGRLKERLGKGHPPRRSRR